MPKNDEGNGKTPPADADNGDVKALLTAVQGQLTKLAGDLTSGLNGQRSMYDRKLDALRGEIKRLGGNGNGDQSYNRPYNSAADDRGADNQDDELTVTMREKDRFEAAKDKFERRHPQYTSNPELRKRVDAILADQSRRADLLTRDDFGRYDYDKTYRTAYLEARDQISIEAEAHAAEARAQADKEKRESKTNATLSGDAVEELPEGLTLDSIMEMSADQMVDKGLVPGVKKRKPIVGV